MTSTLTKQELHHTLMLASLFVFRLLGLFMILPVFSLYAPAEYLGSTADRIGLAIGIYGLSQALLQLPFGLLSDHFGRKPILYLGLSLFALGSLLAAYAHSINLVILGRAIQGAGAIGSTVLASIADLTQAEHRVKAMAITGILIGASFSLAFILGPIVANHFQLRGIFLFCFFLALAGLFIVFRLPHAAHPKPLWQPGQQLKRAFTPALLFLNVNILLLHFLFTANFIAIPLVLKQTFHIDKAQQSFLYLPILFLSALFMMPFIRKAHDGQKHYPLLRKSLFAMTFAQACLLLSSAHSIGFFTGLLIFFTAFNVLEALLPSLVSQEAESSTRGTALGIYSSSQFFGIFLGGSFGGYVYGQFSTMGVLLLGFVSLLIWSLLASYKANKTS